MEKGNTSPQPETRVHRSLRILRPLFWWMILVLVFYGIRTHQRWMEKTRLSFTISLEGRSLFSHAAATLDGKPISSGERISLGAHTFTIAYPKAATFSTNLFTWYGGHDFGTIDLKRTLGTLAIQSDPAAITVTITGPEFSTTLTNVSGKSLRVPTDDYELQATYPHGWWQKEKTTVLENMTGTCVFAPAFGSLHATANRDETTFELWSDKGRSISSGNLPTVLPDLPVGRYRLTAKWHSRSMEKSIEVKKGQTNETSIEFVFGSAQIESDPTGAKVYSASGNYLGKTPLTVTELLPGMSEFELQLVGYDNVRVGVSIVADQTNGVGTNLVSLTYFSGMRSARANMELGNYRGAVHDLELTLTAKPGDVEALRLQREANSRELVQEARGLAGQGDYISAGQKLQSALEMLPDFAEARSLQAEYKTHEREQMAQAKEKETRVTFERAWRRIPIAALFDANEYVTSRMSPEETKNALVKLYAEQWPKAATTIDRTPAGGIYEVLFAQGSANPLETARREMLCVIGQAKDGQTLILFKVFEYQKRISNNLAETLLSGNRADDWIPLHPSRIQMTPAHEEQIKVGVRMMYRKIKLAIGETTTY
jgi:hypothetical protein